MKLLAAIADGRTTLRAVFDEPVRIGSTTELWSALRPSAWSWSGSAQVLAVELISPTEVALTLDAGDVNGMYSLAVDIGVQSSAGVAIVDGDDAVPVQLVEDDLECVAVTWPSPDVCRLEFSSAIEPLTVGAPTLASSSPYVLPSITAVAASGTFVDITLSAPGRLGADYEIVMPASVRTAAGSSLRGSRIAVLGQGNRPAILSPGAAEHSVVTLYSSEAWHTALGGAIGVAGWPLSPKAYKLTQSLAPAKPTVSAVHPSLTETVEIVGEGLISAAAQASVRSVRKTIATDEPWPPQAASVIGAGSAAVVVGAQRITKTAGAPYELRFRWANADKARLPRQIESLVQLNSLPVDSNRYPMVAWTMRNSGVTVSLTKTETGELVVELWSSGAVAARSAPLNEDLTDFLDVTIVDDGLESSNLNALRRVSVQVEGVCVVSAAYRSLSGSDTFSVPSASNADFDITFGHPDHPSVTFQINFDLLRVRSLAAPLFGLRSGDLIDFDQLSTAVTIALTPATPSSSKFGVYAEYDKERDDVLALITLADLGRRFASGTVRLMHADDQVLDEIALTSEFARAQSGREISVCFHAPAAVTALKLDIEITVDDGNTYSGQVPVHAAGGDVIMASLGRQRQGWQPRLSRTRTELGAVYGPGFAYIMGE